MLGKKVGVDLGSVTVRAAVKGEGVVLEEPSVVALRRSGATISALGRKALDVSADDPEFQLVHPLRGAAIVDQGALVALLTHVINRAAGRQRIFKPDIVVAVHSAMSGEDRRVVLDALARANARTCYLLDMPVAAGLGAGLALSESSAHMVVDIGGACVEVAIVAGEGTLAQRTARVDDRCGVDVLRDVVNMGREMFAEISTQMMEKVRRDGAILVGGAASAELCEQLRQAWGIPVRAVLEPQLCAVKGAQKAVDALDMLKRTFMYIR